MAHTIYECEGAQTCAIEIKSFSKNAGFTGVRLGYTVVPKDLKCNGVSLHDMWARRHGTKFNGAPYIVQRAGEAVYSEAGKAQLKEQVAYYMKNASVIKSGLKEAGFEVFGGVNAPYIWLKTPEQMTSWDFFDYLLENDNVVGQKFLFLLVVSSASFTSTLDGIKERHIAQVGLKIARLIIADCQDLRHRQLSERKVT